MKRLLISILSMLLCLMVATGTSQAESSQQSLQTISNTNETGFDAEEYYCKVGKDYPMTVIYKNTSKKPTLNDVTWSVSGVSNDAGANATKTILGKESTHEEGTYWLSASLKFNKTGTYLVTVKVYDQQCKTIVNVNDQDIGIDLETQQVSITDTYADYAIRANVINYGDWYDNFSIEFNPGTGSSITDGSKKHQITDFENSYKNDFTWKVRINRSSYSSGGVYRYKIAYEVSNEYGGTKISKDVEGNIDLLSTSAKDNTLTSNDIFKFKNPGDEHGHTLTKEMKKELLSGLSPSERAAAERYIQTGGNGHCYGMSAAIILNKMGIDPLPNIHALEDEGKTRSTLCYYQISQGFRKADAVCQRILSMPPKERLVLLEKEVKEVATGGSPILLCIGGGGAKGGHALVAYKVEEGKFTSSVTRDQFNRKVYLYDPNRADITSTFLLFNENTDQWEIPGYVSSARDSDATIKVVTNNLNEIDVKNKDASKYNYRPEIITYGDTALQLKDQYGYTWLINPEKDESSGLLSYYEANGNSSKYHVVLPSKNETYTINNISGSKDKLDFGILYDDKYIAVSDSSASNIKVDPKGSIDIANSSKDLKVTIANDNAKEDQFDTYSIEGNGTSNLNISFNVNGIKLNGDDLSGLKVTRKDDSKLDKKTINTGTSAEFNSSEFENDFYKYTPVYDSDNAFAGYRVSLKNCFKEQVNKASNGSFAGMNSEEKAIIWKTGDPLPDPYEVFENGYTLPQISFRYMFDDCSQMQTLDLSHFNTSHVFDMSETFEDCRNLKSLDLSDWDTSHVTNMYDMFYGCSHLTNLNVSHFNTSHVTNMEGMFSACASLPSLDVSNFDTSSVTNMIDMFSNCHNFHSLDLSTFDTSKVRSFEGMFYDNENLTSIDMSTWNTSSLHGTSYMFCKCVKLKTLDFCNFDTTNLMYTDSMFDDCSSLQNIDLSHFDTSKVVDMNSMFEGCEKLTKLDLSNFNTSQVTNMEDMFMGCNKLSSLDLSNFDTSNVTNMENMFRLCWNLTFLDLSHFDISKVDKMDYMFRETSKNYKGERPLISYVKDKETANKFNSLKTMIDLYKLEFFVEGEEVVFHVRSLPIYTPNITLKKGHTDRVAYEIIPSYAVNTNILWTSSDPNIVAVDSEGYIKAIAVGSATITATSEENHSIQGTCKVTVTESTHSTDDDSDDDDTEIDETNKNHQDNTKNAGNTNSSNNQSTNSSTNNSSSNESSDFKGNTSDSEASQSSTNQKNSNELTANASEQAIHSITNTMAKTKSDQDLKDSIFNILQLKAPKATKNSVTIKWNKVSNASRYLVYGGKKGSKYQYLTSTSSNSYTNKKLKKGTYYKYVIIAVDHNGKRISTSKVIIVTTTNGKTNNPTSIKLNKYKVSLKKGKTFTIKAKLKGKKLKTYHKIAYESSNTKIVTVSTKGKITAKKKGKATIYVYAQNGVSKSIKVTVK